MTGNQNRRIALFTTFLGGGGAEKNTVRLAHGFREAGWTVDLVLLRRGPRQYEAPDGVRVIDLQAPRIYAAVPRIRRYLRAARPDILLSGGAAVNVTAVLGWRLANSSAKAVIVERTSQVEAIQNSKDWRRRLLRYAMRATYPWANAIAAVSSTAADQLAQLLSLSRDSIHVIYNPVVSSDIEIKAEETIAHPWFCEYGIPVLVAAGRLTLQKDFTTLLYAFSLVRKERPIRLCILGEGEERTKLVNLISEFGLENDVALFGWTENPYKYMKRASLFVLSSRWEGLPTVLIEAMACGCPVISTDCPGGSAEILEYGKWGRLVPVGDPQGLACAILEELEDPNYPKARADHFSHDSSINKYISLLEELLK